MKKLNYVLASASPRRADLLSGMGIDFTVMTADIDESFPAALAHEEIPVFIAKKKAEVFDFEKLPQDTILITADTIVVVNDEVLNKPADEREAKEMLAKLSGNVHKVITGVCLKSKMHETCFYDMSKVYFNNLTEEEIDFYVRNYSPYDKAGSYGVQEWIGYIGIAAIEGSFYNVMGLPTAKLWEQLKKYNCN